MATVVRVLDSMPSRSSTPTPALVRRSSVRSGSISETASTRVVLPTPKPPATRILTGAAARAAESSAVSYPGKVVPDFHEQVDIGGLGALQGRPVVDQPAVREFAQQERHRREAHVHTGGDL